MYLFNPSVSVIYSLDGKRFSSLLSQSFDLYSIFSSFRDVEKLPPVVAQGRLVIFRNLSENFGFEIVIILSQMFLQDQISDQTILEVGSSLHFGLHLHQEFICSNDGSLRGMIVVGRNADIHQERPQDSLGFAELQLDGSSSRTTGPSFLRTDRPLDPAVLTTAMSVEFERLLVGEENTKVLRFS